MQHFHLIVNHLFVALDILLEDDLHSDLAIWAVCLANDTVGACAEGAWEAVLVPDCYGISVKCEGLLMRTNVLLVIAIGLAVHLVHQAGYYEKLAGGAELERGTVQLIVKEEARDGARDGISYVFLLGM
jgi:hypothetical protein